MSDPQYPPQEPWSGPLPGSPPQPPSPGQSPAYPAPPPGAAATAPPYGQGATAYPPQAPWVQQQGQPWGQPGQPYGQPGQPWGQPGQPWGQPGGTPSRTNGLIIGLAIAGALVLALVLFLVLRDGGAPDAAREPTGLGTDAVLDGLARDCYDGDMQACDDLFWQSPAGSAYEDYGDTCAGRQGDDGGFCVNEFDSD